MRYTPNAAGIRSMLNSSEMRGHMLDTAEDAADEARASAASFARTGAYMRSIRAEAERAGDRWGATVTATVPYAQRVEQKRHTIAQAVDGIEH